MESPVTPTNIHQVGQHPVIRHAFTVLGALALFIVLFGFGRTYLIPMAAGVYSAPLYLHIHAAVFMVWLVLGVIQPVLIRTHRVALHRKLGVSGFALGAIMIFLGLYVAIERARFHLAEGAGVQAKAFLLIPITDMILFGTFLVLAALYRRNGPYHKRYIILSTLSILPAAFGRIFPLFTWWTESEIINGLLAISVMEVTLFAGIVFDFISRRVLHPVYLWGGSVVIIVHFFRDPLSQTETWLKIVNWLLP